MSASRPLVMIIDDDEAIAYAFRALFVPDGYDVRHAATGDAGLALLQSHPPDVIFLDVSMPGRSGLDILAAIKANGVAAPVVMITGFGTMTTVIRAMQLGAYEYIAKPLDVERVRVIAKRALETAQLRAEVSALRSELRARPDGELIGNDLCMQDVFKQIGAVTTTPNTTTVLIIGESGTGKELVARAIHANGPHAAAPFIGINCAVLPEHLLESELFGHERGAFTGATEMHKGKFEQAGDGTIVLDEIGELSPHLQQKFLRVLQEREFNRVGGSAVIPVHARFVAATHRNLDEYVRAGKVREDLYFRLNVVKLTLPPLRERREDIPLLIDHFIRRQNAILDRAVDGLTDETMHLLLEYDYPGNVRELQNLIVRATVMAKGDVLTADLFPAELAQTAAAAPDFDVPITSPQLRTARAAVLATFERRFIIERLRATKGNVTQAAHDAGIERQHFQRMMKRYGISSEEYR